MTNAQPPPWQCLGYAEELPDWHIWCYSHNQVETYTENTYRICFECKHVYETTEDLVAAYMVIITSMNAGEPNAEPLWIRSADQIHFCQECIHDF